MHRHDETVRMGEIAQRKGSRVDLLEIVTINGQMKEEAEVIKLEQRCRKLCLKLDKFSLSGQ